VVTFCGPQPFSPAATRCLQYMAGLRPVIRNPGSSPEGENGTTSVEEHKRGYNLNDCGDISKLLVYHSYITTDPVKLTNVTRHCVSFSKGIIPSQVGSGSANRLFLELLYLSTSDFEEYTIRIWQPVELRSVSEAARNLLNGVAQAKGSNSGPDTLYAGDILALPYSLPGTALFSTWAQPFVGPTVRYPYQYAYDPSSRYGPTAIRAGISAVITVKETGYQTLIQQFPTWSYSISLTSLNPEVEYPYTDTSNFVTLAFQWDADSSQLLQEQLAVSKVGMAALLIATIASLILAAVGRSMLDVIMEMEEKPS